MYFIWSFSQNSTGKVLLMRVPILLCKTVDITVYPQLAEQPIRAYEK